MERPSDRGLESSNIQQTIFPQEGFSIIAIIGILAVITIGLSLVTPALVQIWDRRHQETERFELGSIADGILTYLEQNKAFPPSLVSLSPDFLPFPSAQLTQNDRGYDRYYFVHPNMSSFDDAAGVSSSELPDARVLLISNLTRDESPTITNVAEFETWWATDEAMTPGLQIHRSNMGHLFHQLTIDQDGDGGSYQVNGTATNSGGGPLATRISYHLSGTSIQFDEADTYSSPEVQFALTTNTSYWFDPLCLVNKRWNPLDPTCGGGGVTVRDEFNTIAYNGNDGAQDYSNDWQEIGESDGPTNGIMEVNSGGECVSGNCIRMRGRDDEDFNGVGLSREADLTGTTTATLTFSYKRDRIDELPDPGRITLAVSSNGGASWTDLQTYLMNAEDGSHVPQSFDISSYIASNTQIRFMGTVSNVDEVRFFLDNIEIAAN